MNNHTAVYVSDISYLLLLLYSCVSVLAIVFLIVQFAYIDNDTGCLVHCREKRMSQSTSLSGRENTMHPENRKDQSRSWPAVN